MIDPVALTQALIRCPSVTPLDEGAQDVLIDILKPLGFAAYDVTSGPVRNTFFRLDGTAGDGPHFCYCGHTDVVPAGDTDRWTCPPFGADVRDGRLYGRGAADMKGGIACFVAAVSRFLAKNELRGSISLIITGDEEADAVDGTVKVLEWMAANGHRPDVALVGEPTGPERPGGEIKIGRRGSLSGVLTVTGTQGHVAYPDRADNPLPRMARLLDALASRRFDEGSDHFQPTHLEITTVDTGNTAGNVIPGKATARFNVRFNDLWTADSLRAAITALLDEVAPGGYTLAFQSDAESFLTAPGPLSALVAGAVESVTGRAPVLSTAGGTSDARFVHTLCPVVECGLVNTTIHQIDEHVPLADLETMTRIYEAVLERYGL